MAKISGIHVLRDTKNYIINGNFDFWQRGTSFSTPTTASYLADRFRVDYNGTIGTFSISRQAFTTGQSEVPNNPTYFMRWDHTSAGSGSTVRVLQQRIEGVRSLAGKTVSVSFYAKADTSRQISVSMNQFFGTGGSPSADVTTALQNATLTTAWQKFAFQFTIPSILGKTIGTNLNDTLDLTIYMPLNTTMTIDLAQIQVEEGSLVNNFVLAGLTMDGERSLCQRYFEKSYDLDVNPGTVTVAGCWRLNPSGGVSIESTFWFKATKRATPTMTYYSPGTGASGVMRDNSNSVDRACSNLGAVGTGGVSFNITAVPAGNPDLQGHYTASSEL